MTESMSTRPRILLVDDDDSVLAALRDVLDFEGYEVICASDGLVAMDAFSACPPDLALLDLNMPQKDGWVVNGWLRAMAPLMPIVVITARPDQYKRAVNAGITALMEKPLDFPLLLKLIAELLAEDPPRRMLRRAGCLPTIYLSQHVA